MSRYDDVNRVWDDRAFRGYGKFTDRPGRYLALGGVIVILVLAAVVLGGWWIGWWFKGQNVNRESHLFRNSYANQQTLRDQITQNVGNVLAISTQLAEANSKNAKMALRAQRYAVTQIVCQDADQVAGDPLPSDQGAFVKTNCEAGNVSPSSPFNQGVNP